VTIVFDDATDVYWARQQVAERLQQVRTQIPQGIGSPELGPITTGLGEIYQYVVKPKKGYENRYDATELRTIQDWIVRRQLLGVKGVAEVSSFGGRLKQYEIAVNPAKLQSYGITINDVFTALEKNNQNTGGAYIDKGPTVLFIRSEGLIGNKEDMENISIKATSNGTPLFIRDVADVVIGHATRYGALTYNDQGEVSGAVVMMLKDANSSAVIKNVKTRIAEIQKTLPEGVEIEAFLDRTKMVNNAISTVERNLVEGALIVILVLVLFLGNLRAGLLVASVIPLSMLFAIILMNSFGVSGNLMSLGALDFGLIVDGAVIIVEAVMHRLKHSRQYAHLQKLTQPQMDGTVQESAGKMMNSAVFGQVIILIVYLPIFTLHGIEGKMFKPMAQTVAFALLGAFILSLTYIPMMSAWVLSKKINHHDNLADRIMNRVTGWYRRALLKVLRLPRLVLALVAGLFVLAVFVLTTLGGEFIPELEEGDFAVEMRVLTGSNLNTTIAASQQAAHVLKTRFPEVQKVVTKIGSSEVPTDPMPMEAGDVIVVLKDKSQWASATSFDELAAQMTEALEDVPGITVSFQFPVQMRFNELMTGARQDVVCKIYGEDLDTLASYAQKLGKVINTVQGAQALFIEPVTGVPQIIVQYNRAMLAQYKLDIEDINRVVNTAFAGQSTGLVFEGEKRFDMVVRLQTGQRQSLEDVQNLLVPTPTGSQVPLYQLATVSIQDGPNQVQRENARRRIVVGFNVGGRDIQSIVQEVQQKVKAQIKLPSGYTIGYGGAFKNLEEAKQRLSIAVPVSLVLIFILLFFAFGSVKQGLLIYTAIPLSAMGGIFFLALRGMPFSISAGVGFIALFGVAVLNGIVLIAEFNRLRKDGCNNLYRVVVRGTATRLRPVLMTAFVASLGFLPMAISNGAGAEVQRPLATVVIGGLMIATLLTLFVLPVLYILFERKAVKRMSVKPIAILLLVAGSIGTLHAQQPVTLQAAIDSALKNNLNIKNEKLLATYNSQLEATATSLPQTNVIAEVGQINSVYTDNRFGVAQTFSFPTVYARQRDLYIQSSKAAQLNITLNQAETRKAVTQAFYQLLLLKQKQQLLLASDSMYRGFVERATLRYNKGATDIAEKVTAENQRGAILLQLNALQQAIELARLELQLLMNTETPAEPVATNSKLPLLQLQDSAAISNHPYLQVTAQQREVAASATRLEQARLLPDISIGYYNMTMKGNGADDKLYTGSKRFSSAQLGIGIPIFAKAQKARINAAKTQELIAENNYHRQQNLLNTQYRQALSQYQYASNAITWYEQTALPNAILARDAVNKRLAKGEISYMEWVMLINQFISINSEYIDAIRSLNESVVLLNYLTFKP
jgi:cobalt-zinc-cadmium resistance protein CzcA